MLAGEFVTGNACPTSLSTFPGTLSIISNSRCPELNLGNELSYDAASEMACGCFNEFDEIDVVISLIRDCADHNKRYVALVTNLSDRRTFHFYTQCFW
jgi:hypothetical protein